MNHTTKKILIVLCIMVTSLNIVHAQDQPSYEGSDGNGDGSYGGIPPPDDVEITIGGIAAGEPSANTGVCGIDVSCSENDPVPDGPTTPIDFVSDEPAPTPFNFAQYPSIQALTSNDYYGDDHGGSSGTPSQNTAQSTPNQNTLTSSQASNIDLAWLRLANIINPALADQVWSQNKWIKYVPHLNPLPTPSLPPPTLFTPPKDMADAIAMLEHGPERKQTTNIILHDGGQYNSGIAAQGMVNDWLVRTSQGGPVSSNYHIDCDGKITALVPDQFESYHAGCNPTSPSCYLPGINKRSIGVDLRNCQGARGVVATNEQYTALNQLITQLTSKYHFTFNDNSILAHFEVGMHNDPVPGFDWSKVCLNGVCLQDHRNGNGYCCTHRNELGCSKYTTLTDATCSN